MKKEEFEKLIQTETDILLLDIREADEVDQDSTIAQAQHMPMGKVFVEAAQGRLPKDRRIIVFCRSGMRAAVVVRELSSLGYEIDGLDGGVSGLRKK